MHSVLVSTYEMGRQPFGLASAAAWLRAAGSTVTSVDAAKQPLHDECLASADLIGFHLPMHTATRLAGPIIAKARRLNGSARICAFGLYAPLNAEWLRSLGVDHVLGGEFEEELTAIARDVDRAGSRPERVSDSGVAQPFRAAVAGLKPCATDANRCATRERPSVAGGQVPRLRFLVPDRTGLPSLSHYATLQLPDGTRRLVGYTEASRGCRHLCRHCPVVPIYNGQFRIVQRDVVLADIEAQVRAGVRVENW